MSVIDVAALLTPISAEAPAGADVEFDPAYFELEGLMRGKPEERMGAAVKAAEEPDFKQAKSSALALFEKTRDLRVAMILATALLMEDGLDGFRDGVLVVKGFVETLWDSFYPRLDPEDNNDPTLRANILKGFDGDGSEGDLYKFKIRLRGITLTHSQKKIGAFSYRDIQMAKGEIPPPAVAEGEQPAKSPDMALINAAFEDTTDEDLQAFQAALQETLDGLSAMDGLLTEKITVETQPDFTGIEDVLKELKGAIEEQLAKRGIGEAPAAEAGAEEGGGGGGGGPGTSRGGVAISGEIGSRADVVRVLDKICEYYERFEPASPVPIFMERAKRLVTMNFVDVIRDLAPEAMAKIEVYTGQPAGGEGAPPA